MRIEHSPAPLLDGSNTEPSSPNQLFGPGFIDGEHHPDFYASELYDVVVKYFNHYNPSSLKYFEGLWAGEETNGRQFKLNKALFGPAPLTPQQKLAAANSVWSGQRAVANEFYATEIYHMGVDNYRVIFARGAPQYDLSTELAKLQARANNQ